MTLVTLCCDCCALGLTSVSELYCAVITSLKSKPVGLSYAEAIALLGALRVYHTSFLYCFSLHWIPFSSPAEWLADLVNAFWTIEVLPNNVLATSDSLRQR